MKNQLITTLWIVLLTICLIAFPDAAHARKNAHGAQGTGNYKGKKDRHEKAGPENEKKKNTAKWVRLKKQRAK